jgi:hypothetical protein
MKRRVSPMIIDMMSQTGSLDSLAYASSSLSVSAYGWWPARASIEESFSIIRRSALSKILPSLMALTMTSF